LRRVFFAGSAVGQDSSTKDGLLMVLNKLHENDPKVYGYYPKGAIREFFHE
jgi:hypothetical protein